MNTENPDTPAGTTHVSNPTRRLSVRRGLFLVGFLLVAALALAAYKYLLGRPGEEALQLMPNDVAMVITLDTNPSPQQIVAFKRIADALKREGLTDKVDEFVDGILKKSKVAAQVHPYVSNNFALGMWMKDGSSTPEEMCFLLAVSDGNAVRGVLQNSGVTAGADGTYDFGSSTYGAVVGHYLALSNSRARLDEVIKVSNHQMSSVDTVNGFQEARAALPHDANFMCFVSFDAFMKTMSTPGPRPVGWSASGVTVRDNGLSITSHYSNQKDAPAFMNAGTVAQSLTADTLRELPEGALGVVALAQPGKTIDGLYKTYGSKDEFAKGVKDFEEKTGLDIERDIVPALNGNAQLALYKGSTGAEADVDGVLAFDNANGANPAELATKMREAIEKPSSGAKVNIAEEHQGNATIWRITPSANDVPKDGDKWMHDYNKQFAILLVDGGVYLVSSPAMAGRLLEVHQAHGKTLADDIPFTTMSQYAGTSQANLMIPLNRVLSYYRSAIHSGTKSLEPAITVDTVIDAFGAANTGLVGTIKANGNSADGDLFIPLDYDKLIKLIAAPTKASRQGDPAPNMGAL